MPRSTPAGGRTDAASARQCAGPTRPRETTRNQPAIFLRVEIFAEYRKVGIGLLGRGGTTAREERGGRIDALAAKVKKWIALHFHLRATVFVFLSPRPERVRSLVTQRKRGSKVRSQRGSRGALLRTCVLTYARPRVRTMTEKMRTYIGGERRRRDRRARRGEN